MRGGLTLTLQRLRSADRGQSKRALGNKRPQAYKLQSSLSDDTGFWARIGTRTRAVRNKAYQLIGIY